MPRADVRKAREKDARLAWNGRLASRVVLARTAWSGDGPCSSSRLANQWPPEKPIASSRQQGPTPRDEPLRLRSTGQLQACSLRRRSGHEGLPRSSRRSETPVTAYLLTTP